MMPVMTQFDIKKDIYLELRDIHYMSKNHLHSNANKRA